MRRVANATARHGDAPRGGRSRRWGTACRRRRSHGVLVNASEHRQLGHGGVDGDGIPDLLDQRDADIDAPGLHPHDDDHAHIDRSGRGLQLAGLGRVDGGCRAARRQAGHRRAPWPRRRRRRADSPPPRVSIERLAGSSRGPPLWRSAPSRLPARTSTGATSAPGRSSESRTSAAPSSSTPTPARPVRGAPHSPPAPAATAARAGARARGGRGARTRAGARRSAATRRGCSCESSMSEDRCALRPHESGHDARGRRCRPRLRAGDHPTGRAQRPHAARDG